ncbi:capsular polysaccharide export protein, LipB/KpsS family, partial [Psychrobacter celer]|uniref:capsular polysaccharide export protein, LipB/KpsS family n=1 Tax=Psychrobacter celer TaxID=306572 RepID=UPI003FD4E242
AKQELLPLHNSNSPSDLFLNENPHHFNLSVFQFFDNPMLINEDGILLSKIEELVKKNNVRNVIVNNPYGKEKRLHIYNAFKEIGTKVYVVERGALPNSIYIDPNGFCAESSSYNEENWINNLNDEKIEKTYNYINEYKSNNLSLEPQGNIMGGENLRYKLIGSVRNNKILFVALQSPSDTTTNFFCGDIGSYDSYIHEIQKLCYLLKDSGWIVVYKNHPLTIDKVNFEEALCVDNYHINDILAACDRVTLINSGVGVLAMIYNKPVYYFGQTFYATEGLNKKVSNADELYLELLDNNFDYNYKKSLGFLSFLINDFYSFASWVRKERKHTNIAKMSISENITYEILRVDDSEYIFNNNPIIDLRHSLLFDRYRTEDYIYRNGVQNKSSPNIKKSSPDGVELVTKRVDSLDKLDKNKLSNKKYSIKTKTKKLIKDPNKFFADYFLKKTNK